MTKYRRGWVDAEHGREHGFTLVELLVAMALVAIVLSAAYGWVWSVGALATRTADRAQACTIAAVVARTIAEDVRDSVAVTAPAVGRDPDACLTLEHDHVGGAPEDVVTAWDPARSVVWKNASGTYVADHVCDFRVSYVLADGRIVDGGTVRTSDWGNVRVVDVAFAVEVGSASVGREVRVCVGSG